MSSSGEPIPSSKLSPSNLFKSKIDYKNFECFQQAVLIGLLNQFCTITIKKPRKVPKVTHMMAIISTLDINGDIINVSELADIVCRPLFETEMVKGMKYHAATCRFDKNRRNFSMNLLIDILVEFGFFFESKLAKTLLKLYV